MDASNLAPITMKISLPWKWQPLKRRMLPNSYLFSDGDTILQSTRKLIPLEDESDEISNKDDHNLGKKMFPCGVIGCMQTFTSLLSYENHYNSIHRHTCQTCHKTFPSAYLLEIHIQENHDPLFCILVSRQSMYQCLVESCGERFPTPQARREHMIKTHCYPANFRFHNLHTSNSQQRKKHQTDIITDAMETGSSEKDSEIKSAPSHTCLVQSESSSEKENIESTENTQHHPGQRSEAVTGMEVPETEQSNAIRRVFVPKVPQHFSFGHGISRGFQRPPGKKNKKKGTHWHQQVSDSVRETTTTNIENVDMTDMASALNETL